MRISGKDGKVTHTGDATDYSDVRRISITIEANTPEFGTSGTDGHKASVTGTKRFDCSFDLVLNTQDAPYRRARVGDEVTLHVFENDNRNWIFPVRIKTIAEDVDVDDGGEVTVAVTCAPNGAWTYPDGTVSQN